MIDRNIFAYWDSSDTTVLEPFLAEWKQAFSQFEVISNEPIEPLLEQIAPEYRSIYRRMKFPAAKANIARLIYLLEHGGLYIDCHCGLRSANGVTELFDKLATYEVVFWECSYFKVPRPKGQMRVINSIMMAQPRSTIIRRLLLTALAALEAHFKVQTKTDAIIPLRQWKTLGAGNFSRVLNEPNSETQLRAEYRDRIFWSDVDEGPISVYRHNAYKTDPDHHWSKRQQRERIYSDEESS